jgi:hypothetical protein
MISSVAEIKVDALLAALDEDIRSTQSTLSQLDVLRSLIIKRDDKALEALLRDLQEEAESRRRGRPPRPPPPQRPGAALGGAPGPPPPGGGGARPSARSWPTSWDASRAR